MKTAFLPLLALMLVLSAISGCMSGAQMEEKLTDTGTQAPETKNYAENEEEAFDALEKELFSAEEGIKAME